MNKDQILLYPENKVDLTTIETITLLTWIFFKLTLLASMVNKGAAEFIYAGF
jgi:hypothetical protein